MCRFVAYIGKIPVLLSSIIEKPTNSLIMQSKSARESSFVTNADGFGVGWYDLSIDETPGIFRSIQPAWNDRNLINLVSKIRSTCFVGHVRASTVGDITVSNCHPFSYENYLFVHNGTIHDFAKIKREMVNLFDEEVYSGIRGQTDSEYFFALVLTHLRQLPEGKPIEKMRNAFLQALQVLKEIRAKADITSDMKLNILLTDGRSMLATRYSEKEEPLSLYYTQGDKVSEKDHKIMDRPNGAGESFILASEPLTDYGKEWKEFPKNHLLMVDEDINVTFEAIES